MAAVADDLRREVRAMFERRARGEVRERDFQRQLTDASVALSGAVVAEHLGPGEEVVAEHHLVESHFQVTQSILQEPEQTTVSFFATAHRLLRVRGALRPGRPPTCDQADGTALDELPYARIRQLARRRQFRWGEAAVGLGTALLALLFAHALAVTGPLLGLLGLAGVAHALLLPTRWVEVRTADTQPEPPFAIFGLGRQSARRLLAALHDGIRSSGNPAGHSL